MADNKYSLKVSKDRSANAVGNAIWIQHSDGSAAGLLPGTGATNLGKAVDSAAGGTDTGVALLAVRDDALTTLTPADGDYVSLRTNDEGALWVALSGTSFPSKTDDAAFTIGTDAVSPSGFLADETAPDSVDEGDIGLARMTLDRKVLMRVVGATDANRLDVNASGQAQIEVAVALPAGNNNIGDVDIASAIPAGSNIIGQVSIDQTTPGTTNGVEINAALPAGTNNIGDVDIASALPAGTNNIGDVDVLSIVPGTGATNLGKAVDDAAGATDTGVAALFVRDDALTTLTPADGDYVRGRTDSVGRLWTHPQTSETDPLYVQVVSGAVSGNEIHDEDEGVDVASDTADNHDYTVSGTTFLLKAVDYASSGAMKVEVWAGPVASLVRYATRFISELGGGYQIKFDPPVEVPVTSTGTVRVIRTNREGSTNSVYSTIIGNDLA